jgi:hypothetical protein
MSLMPQFDMDLIVYFEVCIARSKLDFSDKCSIVVSLKCVFFDGSV